MTKARPIPTILMLSILALLAGCHSSRKLTDGYAASTITDSVHTQVEVRYRDTTIILPGDTVHILETLPCPPTAKASGIATGKAGRVKLTWQLKGGQLLMECQADSLVKVIAGLRDSLVVTNRKTSTVQQVPVRVEVVKHKVPSWVWWLIGLNLAAVAWRLRHGLFPLAGRIGGRS